VAIGHELYVALWIIARRLGLVTGFRWVRVCMLLELSSACMGVSPGEVVVSTGRKKRMQTPHLYGLFIQSLSSWRRSKSL
jgi:hypothetical protein